jgi:hypothetical protein
MTNADRAHHRRHELRAVRGAGLDRRGEARRDADFFISGMVTTPTASALAAGYP